MKLPATFISLCFSLPLIDSTPVVSQPVFPIVQGNWRNVNQAVGLFTELHIFDKEAVFTSRGDTVYRFGYKLSVSPELTTLQLSDMYGKTKTDKLLKATSDSLVFASLWGVDKVQRFYKIRKK